MRLQLVPVHKHECHTHTHTERCWHLFQRHSVSCLDSGVGEALSWVPHPHPRSRPSLGLESQPLPHSLPGLPVLLGLLGSGPRPPTGSQGQIGSPLCAAETGSPFIGGLEWGTGGRMRE